jgi:hypothetical protein
VAVGITLKLRQIPNVPARRDVFTQKQMGGYTASSGTIGDELERIWKDAVVALSWYYTGFARKGWKNP